MLKLKDNIQFKKLKDYGFYLEPQRSYYYHKIEEGEIFIWLAKGYDYKSRYLYIEPKNYEMIISSLDVIYKLIKDDILEIV